MNNKIRQDLEYALSVRDIRIQDILAVISCYLEDNDVSDILYRLKNPIVAALSSEYKSIIGK